jgi:hypothetical protein
MKKLSLDVEELDVVQFVVEGSDGDGKGTVYGNASTAWYTAPCIFCPNLPATRTCGC